LWMYQLLNSCQWHKSWLFALASPMECGPELASLPLSTYHSANHEVDSVDPPFVLW
jgi:hypothetical protein